MTDDELAVFLGIDKAKRRAEILASVTPEQRASYEHMKAVEDALRTYKGGARPAILAGAIICRERDRRRRRG